MKSFKEFIAEGSSDKDNAASIRNTMKKEFNLSSRDVSVSLRGDAINIKIKTVKALPYITAITNMSKGAERIDWDKASGEILQGANTFVFVEIDYALEDKLNSIIQDEFESRSNNGNFDRIQLFNNTFEVSKQGGSLYLFLKGTSKHLEVTDSKYIGTAVLRLIKISKDDTLYSKIA